MPNNAWYDLEATKRDFDCDAVSFMKATLERLVDQLKSSEIHNVIVMTGAGVSVSAGIPDFRSPDVGLYSKLEGLGLPFPEAVFSIDYFHINPAPFFEVAKELVPKNLLPTPAHYFIKLLSDKGLLKRLYTQNIDTLDHLAGLPEDKMVEAHGTFAHGTCKKCKTVYDLEWMKTKLSSDSIPKCDSCGQIVKPDVVFFGESLPSRFGMIYDDVKECDLLIIMGTSLQVEPVSRIPTMLPSGCPIVLINLVVPRKMAQMGKKDHENECVLIGTCDDGVKEMACMLGWEDEMRGLYIEGNARLMATYRVAEEEVLMWKDKQMEKWSEERRIEFEFGSEDVDSTSEEEEEKD